MQKLLNQEAKFENQSLFMVYGHRWSREEGGGGVTCIIQDGDTFEKACVYFCLIYFSTDQELKKSLCLHSVLEQS